MSASAAKKKKNQPALATTGRGAALSIALGVTCLTLGLLWLFSMLTGTGSYVLSELSLTLTGLCGPLCPGLPLLLIWGGVKLLVSTRHRVSARAYVIVSALYLMALTGYTLMAQVQQGGAVLSYMDYVANQNYKNLTVSYDSFSAYLYQAYIQRSSGAGGLLGMLLAYPLWKILGRIGALLLVAVLTIALIFLLFRLNPGDLFRTASDKGEQHRLRREQKRRAREQAQAAREAQAAQPLQEYPMDPVQAGQTVQKEETVYTAPSYYQPAPVYDVQPAPQPVMRDSQGFYPVQHDLYDERPPLHGGPEAPAPWRDEEPVFPQEPAPAPVEQAPAAEEETPRVSKILQALRRPLAQEPMSAPQPEAPAPEKKPAAPQPARVQPARQAAPAPVPAPHKEESPDDLPWEAPQRAPQKAETPAPAPRHAAAPARPVETTPHPAVSQKRPAAPVPQAQPDAQNPASGDWASQVRRKEAELKQEPLPEHTTRKGEPKPVYTDPVMPITGEKIAITPKRDDPPPANARLDGTTPPKIRQGSMELPVVYEAPPLRLLKEARHVPQEDSAQEDERRAQIIEGTLGSFGVEAEVRQIMHGPSITRFAIQIAPGIKVSRVTNTADNLALELKIKHVRVEAPIQGTSYIGIEVPNALVSTVSLREVLDSPEMNSNRSPLLVALGKDIAGAPVLCDLSKMPHLLIAGATGSGKSVCINSIVCSLLYRTSPDQVRLIMIDPKQVELSVYNTIPHLLVPVVSDPRKASGALAWVVQEMLERYGKFSAQNVRNLAGYNKVNQGTDQVLPNIVVIIDEMADLMEVCRKDVEESIRRLAALARAAGIYMVLATQRPSVDVITGVIKNNIPSRIAFAVSSGTDSRTIIDINGAEKLMGKGDMLYKPAGASPVRVQGCFVSDEEVNAITEYIGSRYHTDYDPNIVDHLDNVGKEQSADEIGGGSEEEGGSVGGEGSFNDLLRQAIEMAVEDGQTSTSMLQRRLRVGYARAGRLIDEMEKRGIISQSEGSKPRKTLITREQYYELFQDEE